MQKFFSNYPLQKQFKEPNVLLVWGIIGFSPVIIIHTKIFENAEKAILALAKLEFFDVNPSC